MTQSEISVPLVSRPRMFGFYGVHGSGKSVLCAQAAEWFWRTRSLRTRVISLDPGSAEQYERGVAEGYIDYLPADGWTSYAPDVLFTSLAEGDWPVDHGVPNSPLKPGFRDLRLCPKCGKDSGSRGHAHLAQCVSCKAPLGTERLPVTRDLTTLRNVGLQVFEGLSMVSQALLEAQRQSRPGDKFYYGGEPEAQAVARAANDALKKKDPKDRTPAEAAALLNAMAMEQTGALGVASSAEMGHYYKAGLDLMKVLKASNRCPIPMVIWTAHSGRWEEAIDRNKPDMGRRLLGLGPMVIPAKAMMTVLPDFVLFGHVVADVDKGGARSLYLDRHKGPESSSVSWEAKCNILGMPKVFALPDPLKQNGFESLMGEVEKAKGGVR